MVRILQLRRHPQKVYRSIRQSSNTWLRHWDLAHRKRTAFCSSIKNAFLTIMIRHYRVTLLRAICKRIRLCGNTWAGVSGMAPSPTWRLMYHCTYRYTAGLLFSIFWQATQLNAISPFRIWDSFMRSDCTNMTPHYFSSILHSTGGSKKVIRLASPTVAGTHPSHTSAPASVVVMLPTY